MFHFPLFSRAGEGGFHIFYALVDPQLNNVYRSGSLSRRCGDGWVRIPHVFLLLRSHESSPILRERLLPNNTATTADDCTNNIFNSASGCQSSVNITNVASLNQSIYTDDTGSAHSPQSLAIAMAISDNDGADYLCDAGALSAAAIYYERFVCNMLGAIPGFEWATAIGDAIEVIDGASDGVLNGIALGCEVSTLASG